VDTSTLRVLGVSSASVHSDDSRVEKSCGDPPHRDLAFALLTETLDFILDGFENSFIVCAVPLRGRNDVLSL
jgi:hypothetical protein